MYVEPQNRCGLKIKCLAIFKNRDGTYFKNMPRSFIFKFFSKKVFMSYVLFQERMRFI